MSPQLSPAVILPTGGIFPQSTVTFAGATEMEGGVLSFTVTVWIVVAVFPQLSVAVYLRVIVLPVKQSPIAAISSDVTSTFLSQLSVTIGAAEAVFPPQETVTSSTLENTGAFVSRTVIVCIFALTKPQSSFAVQVRVKI